MKDKDIRMSIISERVQNILAIRKKYNGNVDLQDLNDIDIEFCIITRALDDLYLYYLKKYEIQ